MRLTHTSVPSASAHSAKRGAVRRNAAGPPLFFAPGWLLGSLTCTSGGVGQHGGQHVPARPSAPEGGVTAAQRPASPSQGHGAAYGAPSAVSAGWPGSTRQTRAVWHGQRGQSSGAGHSHRAPPASSCNPQPIGPSGFLSERSVIHGPDISYFRCRGVKRNARRKYLGLHLAPINSFLVANVV